MRKKGAHVIKSEKTVDGASYLIAWPCGMRLWFDIWEQDGELTGDWNKYIFFNSDEQDMLEQAFQDANNDEAGAYNFATALSLAIDEYTA